MAGGDITSRPCLPSIGKRIGLWGGSYGGLLTALGLARNSDLFAAGVDYARRPRLVRFSFRTWDESAQGARRRAGATNSPSPPHRTPHVSRHGRSPVLLIQGDDDRNVPFQQTTDLVEKLQAQKVAIEELILPDEIHDLLRWNDWVLVLQSNG